MKPLPTPLPTKRQARAYWRSLCAQAIFRLSRRGPGQSRSRLTGRAMETLEGVSPCRLGAPTQAWVGAARRFKFHLPPALGGVVLSLTLLGILGVLLRPRPEALASASTTDISEAKRAYRLIEGEYKVGARGIEELPDGQWVETTFRGAAPSFKDLPPHPALGDTYRVAEAPGTLWIWATPLGFAQPAWVDP